MIETRNPFKVQNKSVLLFSGGMDSIMYAYLLKPDILLYVTTNSKYEKKELERLERIVEKLDMKESLVIEKDVLDLRRWERDDYIIPNRNVYLILVASMYGETIELSSVNGDRSKDKDREFFVYMEELLNHIWDKQHWTQKREFTITSSFKHLTKTELLKKYLKEGGESEIIKDSWSCYNNGIKPCGICKPCFRKWVALENNGIDTDGYWENEPWKAPWLPSLLPKILKGEYRGMEDIDIVNALKKKGVI